MSEHAIGSDNEGRRRRIRDVFSNDPVYRRVKDGMLIIMAVAAAVSTFRDGIPFVKFNNVDHVTVNDGNAKLESRVEATEKAVLVVQTETRVQYDNIVRELTRINRKLDRIGP